MFLVFFVNFMSFAVFFFALALRAALAWQYVTNIC